MKFLILLGLAFLIFHFYGPVFLIVLVAVLYASASIWRWITK